MKQTSIHIKPCCQAELNEGQKNSKETNSVRSGLCRACILR